VRVNRIVGTFAVDRWQGDCHCCPLFCVAVLLLVSDKVACIEKAGNGDGVLSGEEKRRCPIRHVILRARRLALAI